MFVTPAYAQAGGAAPAGGINDILIQLMPILLLVVNPRGIPRRMVLKALTMAGFLVTLLRVLMRLCR